MQFVVGIDGGGTKTAAVITDHQGQIVGYGESGPSTFGGVPLAVTRANIADAIDKAARRSNLPNNAFSAAFIGLGNVVSEKDRATVKAVALDLKLANSAQIGVDHDIRVALAGGLAGRPGMVMIAGTGVSCYGVNSVGAAWRAGGWGPLIDDEGSSYWLGIQAMHAAAAAYDGRGQSTLLSQLVSERLALTAMDDLMNRLYATEMTRTEIASLARLVFQAAAAEDNISTELIRRGCQAMAECALAVARKIGLDEGTSELAITGGMTHAGEALLSPFRKAIHECLPGCHVKEAELIPAIGAALLALELAGEKINEKTLYEVKQSWEKLEIVY